MSSFLPYLSVVFSRIRKSGIDFKTITDRSTQINEGRIIQAIKNPICTMTARNVDIPRIIV
jgi:hypothetical protein